MKSKLANYRITLMRVEHGNELWTTFYLKSTSIKNLKRQKAYQRLVDAFDWSSLDIEDSDEYPINYHV